MRNVRLKMKSFRLEHANENEQQNKMRFPFLSERSARIKTAETADVNDAYRAVAALPRTNSSASVAPEDDVVERSSKGSAEPR